MKTRNLIIGAGIVGIVTAEKLASLGEEVTIIEKRSTLGGNCYDYFDSDGNYIQEYGPHIFHTNNEEVWNYISKFAKWHLFKHRVLARIKGKLVPLPINLESLEILFPSPESTTLKNKLINRYREKIRISIFDLLNEKDKDLKKLAQYIYENVFLHYTIKQWDTKPEDIDSSVLNRVPIMLNRVNAYFTDKYQGIPEKGFTELFKNMIKNKKIKIIYNTDYKEIINNIIYKRMFYTGPLDYFFDYKYGPIKYRAIEFKKETVKAPFQKTYVVNYPNEEQFTRITEFNKFLDIKNNTTVICKEYPSWEKGIKAYPLQTKENHMIIDKYIEETKKLKNIYFEGRLSECKYYNMDTAIERALEITKGIENNN
ncbi:MAG: UDP-galactopyranose mutase [Nitrospiraceae bacterium]|nr:UDP-galactopyranose mutase [Nitrospiraceae bacterium]